MYTFLFALVVVWILRIVHNIFYFVHLWWVKEYRFDRMMIHLRTDQAKHIVAPPWKRPPISPKSVLLIINSLILLFIIYLAMPWNIWIKLLVIDFLSFPITFPLVSLLWMPTKLYHAQKIHAAKQLLRKNPQLVVIGITGSYGKTSVKEFLYNILSSTYKTLKTEASKNSPIGIAEVVVQKLQPDHEVFIVEMGAYKKGEIAGMAKMVQPQIGIITAINAQHQDLFGSIENTMHAKFELVENLIGKKMAVLNADNTFVQTMGDWAAQKNIQTQWYCLSDAKNIAADVSGIAFDVEGNHIQVPILGAHQVGNILAAITAAKIVGMSMGDISQAAGSIEPRAHTLEKKMGHNESMFIDDTFNNNPDAAKAALDVLALGTGKKILVFQPMIELGAYAHKSHQEVGEYAARICDRIILTNTNWYNDMVRGVRQVSKTLPVVVWSPQKTKQEIQKFLKKDDMVLFKGKEAQKYLHDLQ